MNCYAYLLYQVYPCVTMPVHGPYVLHPSLHHLIYPVYMYDDTSLYRFETHDQEN